MEIKVFEYKGQLVTTSINIADVFGKNHAHVMRDIRNIIDKWEELGLSNLGVLSYFIEAQYINEQSKSQPMYWLTKKGLFLYLFGSNIEICLHMLEIIDISNIFEALGSYLPVKVKKPYYLYLLQSGNSNVYKIGIAKDVNARIRNITHHDKLELVRCWEFKSKSDCRKMEGKVHKALHERRANREWFYLEVDSGTSAEIVDNLIKS